MEELLKRQKVTKESTINEIASSVREISESVTSMKQSFRALLKVNKALVLYLQSATKEQDSSMDEIRTDFEHTRIEEA